MTNKDDKLNKTKVRLSPGLYQIKDEKLKALDNSVPYPEYKNAISSGRSILVDSDHNTFSVAELDPLSPTSSNDQKEVQESFDKIITGCVVRAPLDSTKWKLNPISDYQKEIIDRYLAETFCRFGELPNDGDLIIDSDGNTYLVRDLIPPHLENMKKVFLTGTGTSISIRKPINMEVEYALKGWSRGELKMVKSTEWGSAAGEMYKAYRELNLEIDVLESDLLNEWVVTAGKDRWEFILLNVYRVLLQNNNTTVQPDVLRYSVGEPNGFFTAAIITLLCERIKTNEIKFINALNMAKYHLREKFIHPHSTPLIDGFLKQWLEFSLGHREVMHEWDEVVKIVRSMGDGSFSFLHIPGWIKDIIITDSLSRQLLEDEEHLEEFLPGQQFVICEDGCEELVEILRDAGFDVSTGPQEAALEAFSEMFEPVASEEQPIPRGQTMKGNGRRELTYKNGFTFPKPKRRW